jgi:hypothetical protein
MRGRQLAIGAAVAVGVVLAAALVTGLAVVRPQPGCADFAVKEGSPEAAEVKTATVLLFDVSDNSSPWDEVMAESVGPDLDRAADSGARIVARFSGGAGTTITGPPCLDGSRRFLVRRRNPERQEKDRREAKASFRQEIAASVRNTPVGVSGSAVPLLLDGGRAVRELIRAGVAPADIDVVLYSDLLAVSDDCLGVAGMKENPAVAELIVGRCLEHGQLEPLPAGVGLAIHGAGDRGETSAQRVLAGQLATSLCRRLADPCTT